MAFHVGQKVVCVVKDYWDWSRADLAPTTTNLPKRGEIYTIRGFSIGDGLLFHELPNPPVLTDVGLCEQGFHSMWFRPLIERENSTSTGFEILDDIRKRETFDEKQPRKISVD